ncbi:hypothetical protein PG994_004280 [Apiospora phragmitis]|uniref:Uncharacterized protein n=1 Tax=Apiospora phragmitis TaxID=2905665 RepID=A0ABR1VQ52_9PEZI
MAPSPSIPPSFDWQKVLRMKTSTFLPALLPLIATAAISLSAVVSTGLDVVVSKPTTTVACGTAGICFLITAAPGIITSPDLAALGFGSNGVVLGSAAASVQSGIGSVIAPSLFATLQSAGAGGYGLASVSGVVQVASGAVASSAMGILAWPKAKL